jgi:hypothetical protein
MCTFVAEKDAKYFTLIVLYKKNGLLCLLV